MKDDFFIYCKICKVNSLGGTLLEFINAHTHEHDELCDANGCRCGNCPCAKLPGCS